MKSSNEVLTVLNKITGGGENNTILGGYLANYAVGGNVEYKLKKTIADWEMNENKMKIAKEVLQLDDINEQELCAIVDEMLKLSDDDLVRALFNLANGNEPLRIALRKLYYTWDSLIEIILHIAEKKNIDVSEIINRAKYIKRGFCPYDILGRLNNLFTFPIGEVIDKINIDVTMSEMGIKSLENIKKISIIVDRPKIELTDVNNCIEVIITLYKNLYNHLLKLESNVINLAKNISDFCDKVENLGKIILKQY